MYCKAFFVVFCVSALENVVFSSNIPDYIHICKRTDPQVNKCVKNSIEILKPKLKSGLKDFDVPPIEPFLLNNFTIVSGNSNANFRAELYKVNVYGVSGFIIKKLRIITEGDQTTVNADVKFPTLKVDAMHNVNGKILILPLRGEGQFTANLTNAYGKILLKATVKTTDGIRRMLFTTITLKYKVEDYSVHLSNLFGGDKTLGRAANEAINQSKAEFLNIVLPLVENESEKIFLDIANKITNKFNYDEIFPAK